ncbi:hypothetical protein NST83_23600 [Paenibacillus sp. FSL R10-2782]|uniref:hypothetical protein n=1 Tax=Paenibacillus sp. FSL R10-2782 TaxID=2954661 RepID=UPI0031597BE1
MIRKSGDLPILTTSQVPTGDREVLRAVAEFLFLNNGDILSHTHFYTRGGMSFFVRKNKLATSLGGKVHVIYSSA